VRICVCARVTEQHKQSINQLQQRHDINVYVSVCVYVSMCICVCVFLCVYVYLCLCVSMCLCVSVLVHVFCVYVSVYPYTQSTRIQRVTEHTNATSHTSRAHSQTVRAHSQTVRAHYQLTARAR